MPLQFKIAIRQLVVSALLVIAGFVLLAEFFALIPNFTAHLPNDYGAYMRWGMVERLGPDQYYYALPNYYPLPTTLWVFVPLSLLPTWFSLVWMVVPFLFTLWLFKKSGGVLWLYYPMMVQAAVGQLDGWLLLPLLWLIENRPWFAGIGAVLVLFKPQLSFFTVLFALVFWVFKRDWRNLGAFAATLTVIYLPAFIADPFWVFTMLDKMQIRANENLLPTRGATLWAWAWHGGVTLWLLPLVAIAAAALVLYVFRVRGKPFQAMQLLGLLTIPVLYASNLVTIVPILKTQ